MWYFYQSESFREIIDAKTKIMTLLSFMLAFLLTIYKENFALLKPIISLIPLAILSLIIDLFHWSDNMFIVPPLAFCSGTGNNLALERFQDRSIPMPL